MSTENSGETTPYEEDFNLSLDTANTVPAKGYSSSLQSDPATDPLQDINKKKNKKIKIRWYIVSAVRIFASIGKNRKRHRSLFSSCSSTSSSLSPGRKKIAKKNQKRNDRTLLLCNTDKEIVIQPNQQQSQKQARSTDSVGDPPLNILNKYIID